MAHMRRTPTTLWLLKERMKTHDCMKKDSSTHSAHFYSFVSDVVALLFSPPPSLFAFVQCYTVMKKRRKIRGLRDTKNAIV